MHTHTALRLGVGGLILSLVALLLPSAASARGLSAADGDRERPELIELPEELSSALEVRSWKDIPPLLLEGVSEHTLLALPAPDGGYVYLGVDDAEGSFVIGTSGGPVAATLPSGAPRSLLDTRLPFDVVLEGSFSDYGYRWPLSADTGELSDALIALTEKALGDTIDPDWADTELTSAPIPVSHSGKISLGNGCELRYSASLSISGLIDSLLYSVWSAIESVFSGSDPEETSWSATGSLSFSVWCKGETEPEISASLSFTATVSGSGILGQINAVYAALTE